MQFSGDSKPCQQRNGPYVGQNVMTQKTIGVEYGMAPTLLWHVEDGWQADKPASEREPFKEGGGVSSPLSPAPLEIHFHSSIFIYASSPVECSGILDLSEPEWEVRLYFPCSAFRSKHVAFICRRLAAPRQSSVLVLSQRDDRGVKKKKKSHIQTMENGSHSDRPEESLKTLYPIIKTYISATSGRKTETSLFYEILICDFSGERHWNKTVLTLCPPFSWQCNVICMRQYLTSTFYYPARDIYWRQQNHLFPSTLLTS